MKHKELLRRVMDDSFYRAKFTLLFSVMMNIGYSLLMLVQGIRLSDVWSIVMALYYAALTGMRAAMIRFAWKDGFGTDISMEQQRSRLCGILMLLLDIVLTGVITGYMRQSERTIYPLWQICAMAAFAFYKIVVAIISTVKSRQTNSPAFSAVKWISLCAAYLIAGAGAGLITGASMDVNIGSLFFAVLGKMMMSLGWASLYTFLNVILRRHFGVAIALAFFLGTGVEVIGAAAALGNTAALNSFLFGSSVYACLSSNLTTLGVCALVSVAWAVIYNLLGSAILARSDVY